jgi:hypothetical protein
MPEHNIIGEVEPISLPEITEKVFPARIDTGANTSAIWASKVSEEDDKLKVVFFDKTSPLYTGEYITFEEYKKTRIKSSNGELEKRYKIILLVVVDGRRIRANFTLADRSKLTYPVLIGRNVLRSKFVVDVAMSQKLEEELKSNKVAGKTSKEKL